MSGENWSAMSIWIDQYISGPSSWYLGAIIAVGYVGLFGVAIIGFIKSGYEYFSRQR